MVVSEMGHRKKIDPFNLSSPVERGCHFTDDIFKCIFFNEKSGIWIQISQVCS